jgi:hypothetical protein
MRNREEIEIELKTLGSSLTGRYQETTNDIPDKYFEDLEKQVLAEFAIHRKLARESHTVPDGYFENLASNVLIKGNATQKESIVFHIGMLIKRPAFRAVAASFILVLTAVILFESKKELPVISPEIGFEESLHFIEANMDDIDLEDLVIAGAVEEEDLTVVEHDESNLEVIDASFLEFPDMYTENN